HPNEEPNPQNALIQKANDALTSGDLQTALDLLTRLNTESPNNPQVLYNLGLTLEALADKPTIAGTVAPAGPQLTPEAAYRQSISANPLFAPSHVALGLLLARSGHITEARTELSTATSIPDIDPVLKARALRGLARIDLRTNSPAASSELLDAIRLSPEQPDDILLSAEIAEAAADYPGSERAYRRYLALPQNASDAQATAGLVHALLAQHNTTEAQTVLNHALAQHPGDPTFTAQLAQSYLTSSDPTLNAQAAPLLEKLHASNPSDPNITRLLARVYVETGHPDQADPLYASLIAAAGEHPDPTLLDARADALMRLHRPSEAERLLKQALVNPAAFQNHNSLGDAALHLAFAASEADDPKMTLQALSLRATVQQPSPASLFLEATAYDALHQSSKAVELYKQFLAAANRQFPDQESQARKRISELAHVK
ncbi:MAG TPA: tetratricopeptide repeat protein, partial [Acidobacteriaceae bacterium]|nr:tetratricopeptide repeat protein [Acidobacteriaceae bacterium]